MNRLVRTLLSLALALALLAALWHFGDLSWSDLRETWAQLTPASLGIAVALHAGVYLVRAWRYRVLLGDEVSFGSVLACSAAHNLATAVLPARSGDASLVIYLKAHAGVAASRGVAVLLLARLLDLAALCAGLTLACGTLALTDRPGPWAALALFALPAFLGLLGLVLCGHTLLEGFARRLHGAGTVGWRTWIASRLERVALAIGEAGRGRRAWRSAGLTALVWLGIFAFYAHLARELETLPDLGFAEGVLGAGLAIATNLLPVNFLAGFGTHEAGWVLGFGLLGAPEARALASGLGAHLVQLLDVAVFGALAHLFLGSSGRPEAAREAGSEG